MSSIIGSAMDQSVTQVMMDKALRIIIHALDNIEACMRAGKDEKVAFTEDYDYYCFRPYNF